MRKFFIFLFVLNLPVSAGNKSTENENIISDTEIKQTVNELLEAKRIGVSTSVLGATMTVFGTTIISSRGGPEIEGLGFGMSVAGIAVSALGCYISFAKRRQLKQFLEDHNIKLERK